MSTIFNITSCLIYQSYVYDISVFFKCEFTILSYQIRNKFIITHASFIIYLNMPLFQKENRIQLPFQMFALNKKNGQCNMHPWLYCRIINSCTRSFQNSKVFFLMTDQLLVRETGAGGLFNDVNDDANNLYGESIKWFRKF